MTTTATAPSAASRVAPGSDLADALTFAARVRAQANAEDVFGPGEASGRAGTVYATAAALQDALLRVAYGEDAAEVSDVMLDSGEDHAYAARYVAERREHEHDFLYCHEYHAPSGSEYRASCMCGWEGLARDTHDVAERDHGDHRALSRVSPEAIEAAWRAIERG